MDPPSSGLVSDGFGERYRRRGGAKRSPLPDFFIGAHAAVSGLTLLTRDDDRFANAPVLPFGMGHDWMSRARTVWRQHVEMARKAGATYRRCKTDTEQRVISADMDAQVNEFNAASS